MIKRLRKLGGTWTPIRNGLNWYYTGEWLNSSWELVSYAHLAPRWDGDDEGFVVLWHITRDSKAWQHPTHDPVFWLESLKLEN